MIVLPVLLFGSASVKLATAEDLKRIIEAILAFKPNLLIHVRADSGFGGPDVYETLESFDHVEYTIGMKCNSKTNELSDKLLEETVKAQAQSGQNELRYMSLIDYSSKTWGKVKRMLIIKCEVSAHSTSRRVLISNRKEVVDNPELVYRQYAERGQSENRNKELKCGLSGDRLSDHRYMANLFRVMMHCLSHNLLVAVRHLVALPVPAEEIAKLNSESVEPVNRSFTETKAERKAHNDRRKRDPLGEGHPCTWRSLVIKVAGRITVTDRRVVLELSASWPNLKFFRQVSEASLSFHLQPM